MKGLFLTSRRSLVLYVLHFRLRKENEAKLEYLSGLIIFFLKVLCKDALAKVSFYDFYDMLELQRTRGSEGHRFQGLAICYF